MIINNKEQGFFYKYKLAIYISLLMSVLVFFINILQELINGNTTIKLAYWWVTLIVLGVLFVLIFVKSFKLYKEKIKFDREELDNKMALFYSNMNFVKVRLTDVNVIHSTYYKQVLVDVYGNEIKENKYSFLSNREFQEYVDKLFYDSKLTIPVYYNNKKYLYRTDLEFDGGKLKIWLNLEENGTIFIDKMDPKKAFLDLSFIDNPQLGLKEVRLSEIRELTNKEK